MFLLTFITTDIDASSRARVGLLIPDEQTVIDLSLAAPNLPDNMLDLIALGDTAFPAMQQATQSGEAQIPLTAIKLLAPIPTPPRNIFCVGKNYPEHVKEVQSVVASASDTTGGAPTYPIIFTKAPSSVTG